MKRRSSRDALVAAAVEARRHASAPFSRFRVGAALLTRSGQIIMGANVESASYGLTCCAERVALFKALTDGFEDFIALAVVARCPGGPMPCGACLQLLAEYAPGAVVWVADSGGVQVIREFKMSQLLPAPFYSLKTRQRPVKIQPTDLEQLNTDTPSSIRRPKKA